MPLQHGSSVCEHHGIDYLQPNSVEPDPEQSVRIAESRATWALPLQDAQLMPQSDHLKLQRSAATKAEREPGSDGGKKDDHRQMCYEDKAENLRHLRQL
jgi:hypothetical protein